MRFASAGTACAERSVARTTPPHLGTIETLVRWLRSQRIPSALIGGVAVAIVGRPRVTRDVDALVLLEEDRWEAFLASGRPFGFVSRIPNALAFARKRRVLLVRDQASAIDVDIVFGALPFEKECIARAISKTIRGVRLPVITPEDLMVMKAVARRHRDLADMEAVLDANPKIDRRRIRRWVRVFAEALESPEISVDLEDILGRH